MVCRSFQSTKTQKLQKKLQQEDENKPAANAAVNQNIRIQKDPKRKKKPPRNHEELAGIWVFFQTHVCYNIDWSVCFNGLGGGMEKDCIV